MISKIKASVPYIYGWIHHYKPQGHPTVLWKTLVLNQPHGSPRSGWLQVFGYLLMQRLITIRVAELVFEDMIGIEDGPLPPESYVHCACDLLELCGHFLDNSGGDTMRF